MLYLMLIVSEESGDPWPGDPGFEEVMREYTAFTDMVQQAGVLRGAGRLRPTGTATTVRVRNGKTLCTDGPFAETKEQLGGFYVLECRDLDHALELAAQIPTVRRGCIEVRPMIG